MKITNKYKAIIKPIFYLLGIGFIFFLWWLGNKSIPDDIPSIGTVFELLVDNSSSNKVNDSSSFYDGWNKNLARLTASSIHAFLGLLLSCLISLVIVVIVSLIPNFEYLVNPLALFVKATPVEALAPLFMILFGLKGSYIAASVAISFFPIYIAGIDGLKRVPDKMLRLAEVYHTNRLNQFWHFKRGYVAESMLSALQVSAPLSMVGALVGEYIIASSNDYSLGIFISINSSSSLYSDLKFVAIVLSLFAGMMFYLGGFFIHKYYAEHFRIEKA